MEMRALDPPTGIDAGRAAGMVLVAASAAFFAFAGIFTRSIEAGP